jgi:hypothetical protein
MEHIEFGPWHINVDREATIRVHAEMPPGSAFGCDCVSCKNFALHKPIPYPPEFLELLDRLGIDPAKEIESYELMSDELGVLYAGWFYFVGDFEGDKTQPVIGDNFTYYLGHGQNWNVKQYEGLTISRVEFMCLRLPWIEVPDYKRPGALDNA